MRPGCERCFPARHRDSRSTAGTTRIVVLFSSTIALMSVAAAIPGEKSPRFGYLGTSRSYDLSKKWRPRV